MAHNKPKDPEKTVDLPPEGSRNPDPITDQPGSHPIETGIGAAVGGAVSGLAVGAAIGAAGGPIGAAIGAMAAGAVAGGLAGKGIGELIDPTTQDNWLREYFGSEKNKTPGSTPDTYRPAYTYGLESSQRYTGRGYEDVESDLRSGWDSARGDSRMTWDQASGAVRHAYGRGSSYRRNG